MTKYLMLYNIDTENYLHEEEMVNKILKAIPEAKIIDKSYMCGEEINEGRSLWIPEEKFLIAWTIANYQELLGIEFYDHDDDTTSDNGLECLMNRQSDKSRVKYFED
jgi:hypothetical protein